MFSFFKKKKKEEPVPENNLLEIENSVFNTEAPAPVKPAESDNTDYQSLVYHPPVYDVEPYKVARRERPPVIVDKDQLGYKEEDYHDNISTVEVVKEEHPSETIEIEEEKSMVEPNSSPSVLEPIPETNTEEPIKPIESLNTSPINIQPQPNESDASEQFSLFGSVDGPENKKEQQSIEEEPAKLIQEVKYTEDGHKICPQCGMILKPDAPMCFMCSKSFVLKK